jgi:hypothetical protein
LQSVARIGELTISVEIGKEESMDRRSRVSSALAGFGVISFHLDRAALCCEASCEAIFDMVPARDSGTALCPGCGGASWVPLSTFVPSLRIVLPRLAMSERLEA